MIEVILRTVCEGGNVTLYGLRTAGGWRFSRHVIDQTPALIDQPQMEHNTPHVGSWTEALALIDCYPWHRFVPLEVHPDFAGRVWEAVQDRWQEAGLENRYADRWREACGLVR